MKNLKELTLSSEGIITAFELAKKTEGKEREQLLAFVKKDFKKYLLSGFNATEEQADIVTSDIDEEVSHFLGASYALAIEKDGQMEVTWVSESRANRKGKKKKTKDIHVKIEVFFIKIEFTIKFK